MHLVDLTLDNVRKIIVSIHNMPQLIIYRRIRRAVSIVNVTVVDLLQRIFTRLMDVLV